MDSRASPRHQRCRNSNLTRMTYMVHILCITTEIMAYIPDISRNCDLQKRIALRYLEEILTSGKIDARVVPLVKTLAEHSRNGSFSSDYQNLLLRVQVEAAITHIRERPRDWNGFKQALDHYFPENSREHVYIQKRNELSSLLRIQDHEDHENHEIESTHIFGENCRAALHRDILQCINSEKVHLDSPFLNKLLQDVLEDKYHLATGEEEYNQKNRHNADMQENSVASDDPTDIVGRNSSAESEEDVGTRHEKSTAMRESPDRNTNLNVKSHSRERSVDLVSGSTPKRACVTSYNSGGSPVPHERNLRQRDSSGRALTMLSPSKVSQEGRALRQRDASGRAVTILSPSKTTQDERPSDLNGEMSNDGEQVCHKCRNGGKLVCCNGCLLGVHRKCLGSDVPSNNDEEWVCPVCLHKKAADALAKAKNDFLLAEQRLARFMGETNMQSLNDRSVKSDHGNQTATIVNEEHIDSPDANLQGQKKKVSAPMVTPRKATAVAIAKTNGGTSNEKTVTLNDGDVETRTTTTDSNKQVRQLEECSEQADVHAPVTDGDGHDGDLDEDSEDTNVVKINPKRRQRLQMRGNRIIPGIRRKRLPWSKEEEDTLKEGVKKFSHGDGTWGFQWTRILDFGKGKFHPSRTDVDLKDKWRNLCKSINT